MKKIALAAAIMSAPFVAQANASTVEKPTFYGKLNLSYQATHEKDGSAAEVVSNASRLGLKGKIDLDSNIDAIYKVEYEISPDAGGFSNDTDAPEDDQDTDKVTIKQRNTYAGLKGEYGEVIIGLFDTPLKKVQKKVDLFNDLEGDIKSAITNSDNRTKNTIQYTSPKLLGGLVAKVAQVNSEADQGVDGTSLSLTYSFDDIYLGYAFDTDVEGQHINVNRFVAQAKVEDLKLGFLYEGQNNDGDKTEGLVLSAAYKLGKTTLKAQYGESDIKKDDAVTFSLGIDYKLAKKAKIYGFITDESFEDDSNDAEYYGAGLEYKF